ncbi:MAG: biotin/lipoyl-binding protein [Negativicutes bacterium]|nr:biotin/lipoyl-binding protein [Negativicutes bacterium]
MLRPRNIAVMVLILLFVAVAWATANGSAVDQKSVLSGRVLADGLAKAGDNVREGDIVVVVDTITGPVPAVRANTDGKVKEVLVKPGDTVRTGDVVARIEPARK